VHAFLADLASMRAAIEAQRQAIDAIGRDDARDNEH
jgi:hypothetical protein